MKKLLALFVVFLMTLSVVPGVTESEVGFDDLVLVDTEWYRDYAGLDARRLLSIEEWRLAALALEFSRTLSTSTDIFSFGNSRVNPMGVMTCFAEDNCLLCALLNGTYEGAYNVCVLNLNNGDFWTFPKNAFTLDTVRMMFSDRNDSPIIELTDDHFRQAAKEIQQESSSK